MRENAAWDNSCGSWFPTRAICIMLSPTTQLAGWETISPGLPHTESKMDPCMIHFLQPKKPRSKGGVGMLLPEDPPSSIYGRATSVVCIFYLAVLPPQPCSRYNASSYRCRIGCLIFSAHHHSQPILQILFKAFELSPERWPWRLCDQAMARSSGE